MNTVNMGLHTNNVMSQIQESGTQHITPIVGMPVTLNYYTDRRTATITAVVSSKHIHVKFNKVNTIDYYAAKYEITTELEGATMLFSKRKNGRWVRSGESATKGLGLSLNVHDHYIDPNF